MRNDDLGKLILRLCIGGLMLFHGVHKLIYGYSFIISKLKAAGLPWLLVLGVPIGEVIAPLLIVLGLYTRPAALVQAFLMGVAVWLVHMGQIASLGSHGGYALELQAFYFFGALAVAFLGAGRFGIAKPGKWN